MWLITYGIREQPHDQNNYGALAGLEGDGGVRLREGRKEIVAEAAVLAVDEGERFAARFSHAAGARLAGAAGGGWCSRRRPAASSLRATAAATGAMVPACSFPTSEAPSTSTCQSRLHQRRCPSAASTLRRAPRPTSAWSILCSPRSPSSPTRSAISASIRSTGAARIDTDFVREIEVDQDGLVLTYPGLFRRVE